MFGPLTEKAKVSSMTIRNSKGPATVVSMAADLGLSRTTVSAILGGNKRYSQETIDRVLRHAESSGYRPNRSAQLVRRGRSNTIGIIHAGGPLQVTNERAYHLGRAISTTGYDLLVTDSLWYPAPTEHVVDHMIASRVEGLIFSAECAFEMAINRAIFNRLKDANIPVVLISHPVMTDITTVNSDFEDGFYQLGKHLIERGHRRLSLILGNSPDHTWHDILRFKGFMRAVCEAGGKMIGAPVSELEHELGWAKTDAIQGEVIYSASCPQTLAPFDRPTQLIETLLDKGFASDAILAANDDWAAAIISACMRRGISVPKDIAVTGFDASNLSARFPVPFTTVSQQSEQACQYAVNTLMDQMRGLQKPESTILFPCRLIIRESSGNRLNPPL